MGIGNVQMDQNETIILQSYLKHLLILINSKILNKEVGHPTFKWQIKQNTKGSLNNSKFE